MDCHQQFVITGIVINDSCSPDLIKIINPGKYIFSKGLSPNFFGKNISISAIVGMNGSGKSSLLELIMRMINNIGAFINKDKKNAPCFVQGIDADLYYTIWDNEESFDCILQCRPNSLGLVFGEKKIKLELERELDFGDYEDYANRIDALKKLLSTRFFATVVSNYSLFAYMPIEYYNDKLLRYNKKKNVWEPYLSKTWIECLGDQYSTTDCPLIFTPNRCSNYLNPSKLYQYSYLALERILLLFKRRELEITKRANKEKDEQKKLKILKEIPYIIDTYRLSYIQYSFNEDLLLSLVVSDSTFEFNKFSSIEQVISKVGCLYSQQNSFVRLVFEKYKISIPVSNHKVLWSVRLFFVINLYSDLIGIIKSNVEGASLYVDSILTQDQILSVSKAINSLKKKSFRDKTIYDSCLFFIKNERNFNLAKLEQFNDEDFYSWNGNQKMSNFFGREGMLPPVIFKRDIIFSIADSGIECSIANLSSGEKQFLICTCTVFEAILRARCLPAKYRYRNYNLIFDETELCYHPEYQRTFLSKLTYLLEQLQLNSHIHYNIIVTTHSPFILSDIPQNNILYLEKGNIPDNVNSIRNPFASNINDILHQSFFMNNGMMGEIARKKINGMLSKLNNFDDQVPHKFRHDLAPALISLIGDKFLQAKLSEIVQQFYQNHPLLLRDKEIQYGYAKLSRKERESKIKKLQEEIEYLKQIES